MLLLNICALLPAFIDLTHSAALPSDKPYISWQSEPRGRGTWGILNSCVITLIFCVYTSVHLNVPPYRATKAHKYATKALWTLAGILAPELVLYTAYKQYAAARELNTEMNKLSRVRVLYFRTVV